MEALPGESANFLHAVARAQLPEGPSATTVSRLAVEFSFPESIVEDWVGRFGATETEALCRASNEPGPVAIRVNTLRCTVDECRNSLAGENIGSRAGTVAARSLILTKRVTLPSLKTFRDGFFEMQDEGSQLVMQLLGPQPGELIVDACAGGGGKSLHAAALMENRGRVVALDTDARRLEHLRPRAVRAGVGIVEIVTPARRRETLRNLAGSADGVLVDAPCSGVGTFRRNPDAKLRFTMRMSEVFSRRQRSMLEESATIVRPGGRLVYATCTLLRGENENVVEDFLARHSEFTAAPASEYLARTGQTIQHGPFLLLLPHSTGTDGFFAALLYRSR
jgi:16S rRNA (cytosine967-C5)-methyltransferase